MENLNTRKIVKAAGGAAKVASLLGISSQAVSQWKEIPIKYASRIEDGLGVSRKILRPDDWRSIWPELIDSKPTQEAA